MRREVITSGAIPPGNSFQVRLSSSCELRLRGEFGVEARGPIFYFYFYFFSHPGVKPPHQSPGSLRDEAFPIMTRGGEFFSPSSKPIVRKAPGRCKWRWGSQRNMISEINAGVVSVPWRAYRTALRCYQAEAGSEKQQQGFIRLRRWKPGIVTLKMSLGLKPGWPICRVVWPKIHLPHTHSGPRRRYSAYVDCEKKRLRSLTR